MTGPRVDVGAPAVLSGDQWAARQYVPASTVQADDPKATTNGYGRTLTGDEWSQANRMSAEQVQSWKIPALPTPTIRRDVTTTPADPKTKGKQMDGPAGVVMRQIVAPVLEHPLMSAATLPFLFPAAAAAAPLAAFGVGATMAAGGVYNIAQYGWQKAAEMSLDPETRKLAEGDPDRISGEAAAAQAVMLGLAPLIHVGMRAGDVSTGLMEAGMQGVKSTVRASEPRFSAGYGEGQARSRFAAQLESGSQVATPIDVKSVKGLEPTAVAAASARGVKPAEGLVVPEAVKAGRVKAIETEPANASLQERADVDASRRDYEAQRVAEDQADLASARTADAERVLGLREPEQPDMSPRRRPGGQKPAPFFETPSGAETLGAMASRHGLPVEANPYHPESPLAPEWQAGHDAAKQSYPLFPEGFTMGGSESRIPPDYSPPKVQGFEPTSAPEGASPESAQLAAALKPSRFRGHSADELTQVARSARQTIDAAPESPAATRAKGTLSQVEREFALRGITGDDLAKRIAGETPQAGGSLAPVEGTGPTRTRGLAQGVADKALANHLGETVGDLPEYRQVSMADQATRAASLINENPELARRVATGQEPAPHGLLPESVFVAVEQKAIAEGDVAALRDLATGKLTSEATTMGQRIRALGERDPDSPVKAIQDVVNKRSGGDAAKIAKASDAELATIRDAIHGTPIEPNAWTAFVESLKC